MTMKMTLEKLYSLKWNDDDKINIDEKYLKVPVHIALENADRNKDLKTFVRIYNKDRGTLKQHMRMTEVIFGKYYFDALIA